MKKSRYLAALPLAVALFLLTSCGPSPINGNGSSSSNSNNALTTTPTPTPTTAPSPSPTGSPFECPEKGDENNNSFIAAGVKGNNDLDGRRRYINWDSKGCVIYLVGAAGTKTNYDELIKIAENAPSRGVVNTDHLTDDLIGPGCPQGWLTCNDICIPPDQKCNSRDTVPVVPTPTPKR